MAILKVGNNACFIKAKSSGGRLVTSSGNRLTGAQGGSSFGFSVSPRDYILKAGSSQQG